MRIEPRFRAGPFQVSGGAAMTWAIALLVVGLCCCLPLAQAAWRELG